MAILSEYVEVVDLYNDKPTRIYLPYGKDMYVADNRELDGTDEVIEEYCKIGTKDGDSYIFKCSRSFAISLYREIMRFKMADLLGVRTNKNLYINIGSCGNAEALMYCCFITPSEDCYLGFEIADFAGLRNCSNARLTGA